LAAAVAVSVATGIPLLDWTPHPGPVLILDWESGGDEWHRRLAALSRTQGVALPPDIHYRRCEGSLAAMAEGLARWVQEHEAALVVVDSVGMASGAGNADGDASETAIRLFAALRDLGTTSLLIDHVTGDHVTNASAGTRPYGSVFKVNLARSCWELRKEERPGEDGTQLLLKHRKVNEGRLLRDIGLLVEHGEGVIRVRRCEISAPDLEGHAGTTAEQMHRLLTRQGLMTTAEIADQLSKSPASIRVELRRHQGRFVRVGEQIGVAAL
ncbi:MAG: AAA family ATPase, partial [Pseudonocardiaceae bacterium]